MNKSDIRKKAQVLGYKLQFKTNNLNSDLIQIGFKHDQGSTIGSNCFHAEFIDKHKTIFELLRSLDGLILDCTQQKIRF